MKTQHKKIVDNIVNLRVTDIELEVTLAARLAVWQGIERLVYEQVTIPLIGTINIQITNWYNNYKNNLGAKVEFKILEGSTNIPSLEVFGEVCPEIESTIKKHTVESFPPIVREVEGAVQQRIMENL